MSIKSEWLQVKMPDGSFWAVPIGLIAYNRATCFADEFEGKELSDRIEKSLNEDTLPLFEEDNYEIKDWAANNMNWSDVKEFAVQIKVDLPEPDYQEGWVNGEKKIIETALVKS